MTRADKILKFIVDDPNITMSELLHRSHVNRHEIDRAIKADKLSAQCVTMLNEETLKPAHAALLAKLPHDEQHTFLDRLHLPINDFAIEVSKPIRTNKSSSSTYTFTGKNPDFDKGTWMVCIIAASEKEARQLCVTYLQAQGWPEIAQSVLGGNHLNKSESLIYKGIVFSDVESANG